MAVMAPYGSYGTLWNFTAVMALYGSYGTLWHFTAVMAHYGTLRQLRHVPTPVVRLSPLTHVVFLHCLATVVKADRRILEQSHQYNDHATERITEESGSIPDNGRDFTLTHQVQTASAIHIYLLYIMSCYRQLLSRRVERT